MSRAGECMRKTRYNREESNKVRLWKLINSDDHLYTWGNQYEHYNELSVTNHISCSFGRWWLQLVEWKTAIWSIPICRSPTFFLQWSGRGHNWVITCWSRVRQTGRTYAAQETLVWAVLAVHPIEWMWAWWETTADIVDSTWSRDDLKSIS